jgi:hypothetical protein
MARWQYATKRPPDFLRRDVAFWHKADVLKASPDVRFWA